MTGERGALHPRDRRGAGRRSPPTARRRSCCSTAAAGRTSSPARTAAARGSARTATSRWCCTWPRGEVAATTAAIASACPSTVPTAARATIARHGAGTERLQARAQRRDRSTPSRSSGSTPTPPPRDGVANVLRRFEAAPGGVLVGTQMVAKGHDFPDVTLGVVLDADSTLNFPDFRAEERTFALVAQLAGRSGRGGAEGRVLVQTCSPETRALRFASRHDSEGFVTEELKRREAFGYPPFGTSSRLQTASRGSRPGADRRRPPGAGDRRSDRRPRCSARRPLQAQGSRALPDRAQDLRPRRGRDGRARGRRARLGVGAPAARSSSRSTSIRSEAPSRSRTTVN